MPLITSTSLVIFAIIVIILCGIAVWTRYPTIQRTGWSLIHNPSLNKSSYFQMLFFAIALILFLSGKVGLAIIVLGLGAIISSLISFDIGIVWGIPQQGTMIKIGSVISIIVGIALIIFGVVLVFHSV